MEQLENVKSRNAHIAEQIRTMQEKSTAADLGQSSLTPAKLSMMGEAAGFGAKKKSLGVLSNADSIESYKKRSTSLFRNPLEPAMDGSKLMEALSRTNPRITKPAMFQSNTDFITKGVGEAENGVVKAGHIHKLVGHVSNEYKTKILSKLQ